MFNFKDFINILNCSETIHPKIDDALRELVNYNRDKVSYTHTETLALNNLAFVNKDLDGNYFTEINLTRPADIVTDFHSSEGILSLNLGKILTPLYYKTILVPSCSMYTELIVRITFKQLPKEIKISYTCSLLKPDIIDNLRTKYFIVDNISYGNGMCSLKN